MGPKNVVMCMIMSTTYLTDRLNDSSLYDISNMDSTLKFSRYFGVMEEKQYVSLKLHAHHRFYNTWLQQDLTLKNNRIMNLIFCILIGYSF